MNEQIESTDLDLSPEEILEEGWLLTGLVTEKDVEEDHTKVLGETTWVKLVTHKYFCGGRR